jgi:hypothetical protein
MDDTEIGRRTTISEKTSVCIVGALLDKKLTKTLWRCIRCKNKNEIYDQMSIIVWTGIRTVLIDSDLFTKVKTSKLFFFVTALVYTNKYVQYCS